MKVVNDCGGGGRDTDVVVVVGCGSFDVVLLSSEDTLVEGCDFTGEGVIDENCCDDWDGVLGEVDNTVGEDVITVALVDGTTTVVPDVGCELGDCDENGLDVDIPAKLEDCGGELDCVVVDDIGR